MTFDGLSRSNIVLTGVPRSGTTLCCHLVNQVADCVALFEPMDVGRLPAADVAACIAVIKGFFATSRRLLLEEGRARSQQIGGEVPDNPITGIRDADGRRVRAAAPGEIHVDKPLGPGFTLVVKHNAAFTALLPELATAFPLWAVVRNPLAVLASWNSVSLPVSRGRLPAGERLDPMLAAQLPDLPDLIDRQLLILDWFFGRFARYLPDDRVLRYEAIVASGGSVLGSALGLQLSPTPLQARNASADYDRALCRQLASRLLDAPGQWRQFYTAADIRDLARTMAEDPA